MSEQTYAYYIRASSDKQTDQHQIEAIEEWLRDEQDVDPDSNSVRRYADFAESGSNNEREDFTRLLNDIQQGEIDVLVAWELSRITRDGEMLQTFLNACEASDVHIYFTHDNISDVERSWNFCPAVPSPCLNTTSIHKIKNTRTSSSSELF
jgi:DNA invertase Pin-like site-specific DNA recombinase